MKYFLSILLLVFVSVPALAQEPADWQVLLAKADSLQQVLEYDSALAYASQALGIAVKIGGGEDTCIARIEHGKGNILFRLGNYDGAESAYMHSLRIREKTFGVGHPDVARSLNNLALLYKVEGRLTDAEPLCMRALRINEEAYGSNHVEVARSLSNLAILYEEVGRYADAEPLYLRALHIDEDTYGTEHAEVARSLNDLAILYRIQGRFADAFPLALRALHIKEKTLGPQHPDVATSAANLAILYNETGRYEEAERLFLRSLQIVEYTYGAEHPEAAQCLNDIAAHYHNANRYADAESYFQRALRIYESALGSDNPEVAATLNNLANLYSDQGRHEDAEPLYYRALSIYEKCFGPDHPSVATNLLESALSVSLQGRPAEAVASASRGWEILGNNFQKNLNVLTERAMLEFAQTLTLASSDYLSILCSGGSTAHSEDIARVILNAKGIVLEAVVARQNQTLCKDSVSIRLAAALRQARSTLAKLYVNGPREDSVEVHERKLDSAMWERNYLEAELARHGSTLLQDRVFGNVKTGDVIAALPDRSVLVEFMRYQHRSSFHNSEPYYIALVLKPNSDPNIFQLGKADEIDSAVFGYRRHFASPGKLNPKDYPQISKSITELIWNPIASELKDANTIFVSPDGSLNLVSFAGLLDDKGNYLIEDFAIHYLSSGRDLIRLQEKPESGIGLLAMGDADFDATVEQRLGMNVVAKRVEPVFLALGLTRNLRSGCQALSDLTVSGLPGTRDEIESVKQSWAMQSSEPGTVYFGSDASEEKLKQECSGKRVIHLATHGFFLGDECRPKGKDAIGETPFLHSGLLLAGANLKGAGTDSLEAEDGIVTAEEIAGLNLQGTGLVVLSACETGLGNVKSGEGVFGLRRAFQLAGARTVISALWKVDDKSTASLMESLYQRHDTNLLEAIRAAQLDMIKNRRDSGKSDHPFYWAAFIATGDWEAN